MNDDLLQSKASETLRLEQRGRAGELLPIVLLNGLLNIVTLFFYRFWGKTRVRQYLWRQTYFMDEPLEYTGTGGELFKGFLAVFFLIILPLGVVSNLANLYLIPGSTAFNLFSALSYLVIFFLIGMAIYRARRYRLSRTRWRGIRGAMVGSSGQYALRYVLFWALTIVTLGLAYPWMRVSLFKRIMEDTRFGDGAFRMSAPLGPLYKMFAVCWICSLILVPLTLILGTIALGYIRAHQGDTEFPLQFGQGIQWTLLVILIPAVALLWVPWYRAREFNHFAAGTSFKAITFKTDLTAWNLIGLVVPNFLIILLTLGFGLPFAQLRTFRYFCRRLTMIGSLDVDWLRQSSAEAPTVGEGLADAFDLGAV